MNYLELEKGGMDMQELMIRLMNNERLVGMFVKKFLEDKSYDNLAAAIEAGDMEAAEKAVHALKGVSGNMAITTLFAHSQEQLRLFRAGQPEKAVAIMGEITNAYDNAVSHMKLWLAQQ